jgi:hypothetical protein
MQEIPTFGNLSRLKPNVSLAPVPLDGIVSWINLRKPGRLLPASEVLAGFWYGKIYYFAGKCSNKHLQATLHKLSFSILPV